MDKQLRQTIKHDKLQEAAAHGVEYLGGHIAAVKKYGGIAAAVVVLVAAVWGFLGYRARQRQADLREATLWLDAFIGDNAPPGVKHVVKTQQEKDESALKAFTEVANRNSGSTEGSVARFFAATHACDTGKIQQCETAMRDVMNGSDAGVASLAKLSLITLYQSQGKLPEAETLARQLVEKPTLLVSKEQAQIALAESILKSKPQEARLLLETLQATDRPPVTRAAVRLLGEMMGVAMPNMPRR
ncbi:MAG: tetratricopeptide repeat protein [Acidobacteria bacterium]|nr:tetratricopeptide repeat protein [Acidobacteriota bacterium]